MKKTFHLRGVALTDVGCVRKRNEDAFALIPDDQFFVLADGMGGHKGGDVASRACIHGFCAILKDALDHSFASLSPESVCKLVKLSVEEINRIIYRMGQQDPHLKGMGTTFCVLLSIGEYVVYGHVGDSRIYLYQDGHLLQLTQDHTLLRELLEMGQITEREADVLVYKNVLTRAVGTEPHVEPAVQYLKLKGNELFLICSDGLTDHLTPRDIEDVLKKRLPLDETAAILLKRAKARGGHDNITILLVENDSAEANLS